MRILPSQSTVIKRKVGSTASFTTVSIDTVALDDRRPVVHARAAQRIDPDAHLRLANRLHIDHVARSRNIRLDVIVAMGARGFKRASQRQSASPRASPSVRIALALFR